MNMLYLLEGDNAMTDFKKAMLSPSVVYSQPNDVVLDDTLTKEEKIKILRQWEYDARDILVAEEENMIGTEPAMLGRILHALEKLGVVRCGEHSSPTKQGGEDGQC